MLRRQLLAALGMVIVFTVLTGIVYPLVVTAIGQLAFHDKAEGSLVEDALAFDLPTSTWTTIASPVSQRRNAVAVSADQLAILWGGDSWGNALMDGARLGLAAPSP